MNDRRSFLKRCLGLALAPLVPLRPAKATVAAVTPPAASVVQLASGSTVRYFKPMAYGEFFTIPAKELMARNQTARIASIAPADLSPAEEPLP